MSITPPPEDLPSSHLLGQHLDGGGIPVTATFVKPRKEDCEISLRYIKPVLYHLDDMVYCLGSYLVIKIIEKRMAAELKTRLLVVF